MANHAITTSVTAKSNKKLYGATFASQISQALQIIIFDDSFNLLLYTLMTFCNNVTLMRLRSLFVIQIFRHRLKMIFAGF